MRPKLILDTNIGTDVDDAYALLLALGSSEFDLSFIDIPAFETMFFARIANVVNGVQQCKSVS